MWRRRYKNSPVVHASTPLCRLSNHEGGAWAENYGLIQKIVALHLQPHWKKPDAHLRGAAQGLHVSVHRAAHWAAWAWQFAPR